MLTRIHGKKVLLENGLTEGYVYMQDGKIIAVGRDELPFDKEYEAGDNYVVPGLIDIHTHGALGGDYGEGSPEEILRAVAFQVSCGATSVLPTVSSSSYESTYKALENIEKAMEMGGYGDCILGAHLEGPYFSLQQCGAQDKELITEPKAADYKRLIERFGHIIKRWDYAPERDQGGEFCAYLQSHGILPSAGHTDAKYADMCVAREKGCRLITHLYSCTSTITREQGFRKLGVTECAYLWDDMFVEIIADGKHLPIELLQLIFKLKPHDKIILITDSLKVAGLKEKYSSIGAVQCVVEDGVCKLLDRSAFAGSVATADRLIRVCKEAGLTVEQAVRMGSENAARLLGVNKGVLKAGYDADVVIADEDFNVKKVFIKGEKVCC